MINNNDINKFILEMNGYCRRVESEKYGSTGIKAHNLVERLLLTI